MDTLTINKGESQIYDGVTYSAISNAVLNRDGKVSGLASGIVQATIAGAQNSPVVTFDATNDAIDFAAQSDGNVLSVTTLYKMELIEGNFTFKDNTITASVGSRLAAVNQLGVYSLRNEDFYEYGATYSFNNSSTIINSQHTFSQFSLTNGTDTRTINLEAFGTVINKFSERGFTLVAGSREVMHIGDYTLTARAIETAGLNISLGANGVTLVPNKNDGALNIVLSRSGVEIISGDLECTSGSITFGFDKAVTLAENTCFNFSWYDYVTSISSTSEATTDY